MSRRENVRNPSVLRVTTGSVTMQSAQSVIVQGSEMRPGAPTRQEDGSTRRRERLTNRPESGSHAETNLQLGRAENGSRTRSEMTTIERRKAIGGTMRKDRVKRMIAEGMNRNCSIERRKAIGGTMRK